LVIYLNARIVRVELDFVIQESPSGEIDNALSSLTNCLLILGWLMALAHLLFCIPSMLHEGLYVLEL